MSKYENLRPPITALRQEFSDSDICRPTKDKKVPYQRDIFYTVPLHDEEVALCNEVENKLRQEKEFFPTWWTEADTLRFVHEFGFNKALVAEKIKEHFRWLRILPGADLSVKARDIVEYGILYQLGRDNKFRPNVYLALSKATDIQDKLPLIIEALMHILVLVRRKMLLTFYIEKWNLFVDCSGSNELASSNVLSKLYQAIRDNFPQTLHKVFLFNAGLQESTEVQYTPVFGATMKDKIISIQDKNDKKLAQHFDRDQLEQKYGGSRPNLIVFWPPPSTYEGTRVSKDLAEKRQLSFFRMDERSGMGSVVGHQSEYRATNEGFGPSDQFLRHTSPTNPYGGRPGVGYTVEETVTTTTTTTKKQPQSPQPPEPSYFMESYQMSPPGMSKGPPRGSTTKVVEVYTAEEDVELPGVDLIGKYKSYDYVAPNFQKTYHPRVYREDYKQHGFRANASVQVSEIEKDKQKKINKPTFMDLLGCSGR